MIVPGIPLRVVDGLELPSHLREALRPGDLLADATGRLRRLPRFFFEVTSWQIARQTDLARNFTLNEFIEVDVREAAALRDYPRYIPVGVMLLVAQLQLFRQEIGVPVHISVNGGYRSPGHDLGRTATPHSWGGAVNIFRIGDELVDSPEAISRFGSIVARAVPGLWARPYGMGPGATIDHLHLEIGYVTLVPRDAAGEAGDGGRT